MEIYALELNVPDGEISEIHFFPSWTMTMNYIAQEKKTNPLHIGASRKAFQGHWDIYDKRTNVMLGKVKNLL